MVEFHGWHMPLYYTGMTEEHRHTRTQAGLFDLGHMGRIMLRGPGAREFVDELTPAHMRTAEPGDVLYSFLLDEQGHTIDDITIYVSADWLMLVVNASGLERDLAWIRQQAAGRESLKIEDASDSLAMIALQGPLSDDILCEFLAQIPERIGYYKFRTLKTPGLPYEVIISQTGYTGEHGYELYLPSERALGLWTMLMASGGDRLRPIGLGARDSLRLEAAMPLYGHELDETTTPLEAGLAKFLDFEKPRFVGREALVAQKERGVSRKLIGFELKERGSVPRAGSRVLDPLEREIGKVTSGIFSPSLEKMIGMAYVDAGAAQVGSEVVIDVRGRMQPAVIVKRPFYRRG